MYFINSLSYFNSRITRPLSKKIGPVARRAQGHVPPFSLEGGGGTISETKKKKNEKMKRRKQKRKEKRKKGENLAKNKIFVTNIMFYELFFFKLKKT